jgi:hypothetical protein
MLHGIIPVEGLSPPPPPPLSSVYTKISIPISSLGAQEQAKRESHYQDQEY